MFLIELERVPVKLMHNGATDSVGLPLPALGAGRATVLFVKRVAMADDLLGWRLGW